MKRTIQALVAIIVIMPCSAGAGDAIDFRKDIEPLFRQHCLRCHGADSARSACCSPHAPARWARGLSRAAIVPGHSNKSELIRRITTTDKDERMPPSGERLTAAQSISCAKWIDQGADWPKDDRAGLGLRQTETAIAADDQTEGMADEPDRSFRAGAVSKKNNWRRHQWLNANG